MPHQRVVFHPVENHLGRVGVEGLFFHSVEILEGCVSTPWKYRCPERPPKATFPSRGNPVSRHRVVFHPVENPLGRIGPGWLFFHSVEIPEGWFPFRGNSVVGDAPNAKLFHPVGNPTSHPRVVFHPVETPWGRIGSGGLFFHFVEITLPSEPHNGKFFHPVENPVSHQRVVFPPSDNPIGSDRPRRAVFPFSGNPGGLFSIPWK